MTRKIGKTNAMVMDIKFAIENGNIAGVAGCKDPHPILDMLNSLGMCAKSKPMTCGGKNFITGYLFYQKK